MRHVPVNPVTVGSDVYLMSPRGETNWVKNIRASGEGTLLRGRATTTFTVEELPDEEDDPALRAYLDAGDASLRAIAPDHPVFRMLKAGSRGFH